MNYPTRFHKVVMAFLYACDELKRLGLIEGGERLTDKGRIVGSSLLRSGFRPTDDELKICIKQRFGEIDAPLALLKAVLEGRLPKATVN